MVAAPVPLVDSHVHLLPDRLAAAIRGFFTRHMPTWSIPYPHAWEPARAAIVAAGVTRCWSLPYAHKPGMASALNRWMAETFGDDPVVEPGGTAHPGDDVAAVVDEALGPLGLRLLKLHCSVGEFHADDPRLDPLWARVSHGGQPVVVHVGHAIDGQTTATEVAEIGRVAARWPDARIVLAHCGGPAIDAGLALVRASRSVHADLTPVASSLATVSRTAIAELESRLLFGSDAPNTAVAIERTRAHVEGLGLDPAQTAAILAGNATALLSRL